ncbi:complement factor B [Ixodes scapularis]
MARILSIRLTDRKNTSHEQEVFVEEIIRHDGYIEATKQNDIALLRLNQTITFNEFARPICLPPSYDRLSQRLPFYIVNQTAFVIGWGVEQKGRSVERLKQLKLRIQTQETCRKAFENFTYDDSMMCAKYAEAKGDACKGDSGGPLMQGVVDDETVWTQVGVVSWGDRKCSGRKPGVYANVARYVPWINEVMSRARNVSDAAQPPLPSADDKKA